jgi:hypothetical protein
MEILTVQGQSSIICEYLFWRKVYALFQWCGVQFYETKSEIKQTIGTEKKRRRRKTGKINKEKHKKGRAIFWVNSRHIITAEDFL